MGKLSCNKEHRIVIVIFIHHVFIPYFGRNKTIKRSNNANSHIQTGSQDKFLLKLSVFQRQRYWNVVKLSHTDWKTDPMTCKGQHSKDQWCPIFSFQRSVLEIIVCLFVPFLLVMTYLFISICFDLLISHQPLVSSNCSIPLIINWKAGQVYCKFQYSKHQGYVNAVKLSQ